MSVAVDKATVEAIRERIARQRDQQMKGNGMEFVACSAEDDAGFFATKRGEVVRITLRVDCRIAHGGR